MRRSYPLHLVGIWLGSRVAYSNKETGEKSYEGYIQETEGSEPIAIRSKTPFGKDNPYGSEIQLEAVLSINAKTGAQYVNLVEDEN